MIVWINENNAPVASSAAGLLQNRELGSRRASSGKQQFTAALGALAQNEVSRWPRQRVFGLFFYLRDDDDGCALCVTEDRKTVYKVCIVTNYL